jgi:hypothetical protein
MVGVSQSSGHGVAPGLEHHHGDFQQLELRSDSEQQQFDHHDALGMFKSSGSPMMSINTHLSYSSKNLRGTWTLAPSGKDTSTF